jgi:hypothetical protein
MEQCGKFYGPVYVELDSKVGEHVYQWEKDGISSGKMATNTFCSGFYYGYHG